ncbi:hypothetical protein ABID58_000690 [Bradyrhizobium sp. S3.2.6]|uniref:hypothetical protein n=1 Tax=Bradyrhizobium sp. S3.2.6 TaxID=3156428 RepID=UPI003395386B
MSNDFRDAVLECEPLLQKAAVRPSAVAEFRELYAPLFRCTFDPATGKNELLYSGDDPDFRGLILEEAVPMLKELKPHYFYSEDLIDDAEAAFGAKPSLAARGKLMKEIGEPAYYDMAQRWGSDGVSLKPGARPDAATRTEKDGSPRSHSEKRVSENNPWSSGHWNITRQGEVVKALGLVAAQGIAKAAGSYVGATKPVR